MFFIGLEKIELNIKRVKQRVKSGGHNIPNEDIIRREKRVTNNLISIISLLDQLIVLDNTKGQARMIMNFKNNTKHYSSNDLPSWAEKIRDAINDIK